MDDLSRNVRDTYINSFPLSRRTYRERFPVGMVAPMIQPEHVDANGIVATPQRGKPPAKEVETCRAYLRQCDRTNLPKVGSYGLKHVIENYFDTYISNGAAIVAAVLEGFPVQHIPGTPNCKIGISLRSMKAMRRQKVKAR